MIQFLHETISRGPKRLPYLVVFVMVWSLFSAGNLLSGQAESRDVLLLQDHLNRLTEEEASLRREMKEGMRIATRPYTAYLLHQKSLRLMDGAARLAQLQIERRETLKRLALMEEGFDIALGAFHGAEGSQRLQRYATYSGAPILAFNYASSDDLGAFPRFSPFWTNVFRFLFAGVVFVIFSLPLIVIQRRRGRPSKRGEKGLVRVFPLLTVCRANGHREPLRMVV
ncbi:MAG: hypothetical protein ACE5HN_08505 [Nitrospiria bacterium]